MIKFGLVAALLVSAAPALAQLTSTTPPVPLPVPPPPPPPPPSPPSPQQLAVRSAATAYNDCLSSGVSAAPAAGTPQQAAATVITGCATQRTALDATIEPFLATVSGAEQTELRGQLAAQSAGLAGQLANVIAQVRAARAAPPASTPAPAPTPPR